MSGCGCNDCGCDDTPQAARVGDEVVQARRRVMEAESHEDVRRRETRFFHETLAPYVDALRGRVGRRNDVQWDAPLTQDTALPDDAFAEAERLIREMFPHIPAVESARRHRTHTVLRGRRGETPSASQRRRKASEDRASAIQEILDKAASRKWLAEWIASNKQWQTELWLATWRETTFQDGVWLDNDCSPPEATQILDAWDYVKDHVERVPEEIPTDWGTVPSYDYNAAVHRLEATAWNAFCTFDWVEIAEQDFAFYPDGGAKEVWFNPRFTWGGNGLERVLLDSNRRLRAGILIHEMVHMIDWVERGLDDLTGLFRPDEDLDDDEVLDEGEDADEDGFLDRRPIGVSEYRAAYVQARMMNLSDCEGRWFGETILVAYQEERNAGWFFLRSVLTQCTWIGVTILELAILASLAAVGGPAGFVILVETLGTALAVALVAIAWAWWV